VTVLGGGGLRGSKSVENDIVRVVEYVRQSGEVSSVAVEACTVSSVFAEQLKKATGWEVKLCHPGYVNRMGHNPDKSDKTDSYLLADLNRVGYLPEVWLAPEEVRELRALVRYRKQIVDRRKVVKVRLRAILRQHRLKLPEEINNLWTERGIGWLASLTTLPGQTLWIIKRHLLEYRHATEELKEAEAPLREITAEDVLVRKLLEKPGIGLVAATAIRAEVGTFTRFRTWKQLSRFCGVTPRNSSSGEKQADAGLIRAGNPVLKTALIEASHTLMRYDIRWKSFAKKLKAQGKPYGVIVAAVANRWVRSLFHEMCGIERGMVDAVVCQ
jgi:transposase